MDDAGTAVVTPHRRRLLHRPVLASSLVAGALWLFVLAIASWPLALIGLVYVTVASVVLDVASSGGVPTVRRLALVCALPWGAAVAMWTWLLVAIGSPASAGDRSSAALMGLVVGSGCFAVWQVTAFLVRQFLPGATSPGASAPPWAD